MQDRRYANRTSTRRADEPGRWKLSRQNRFQTLFQFPYSSGNTCRVMRLKAHRQLPVLRLALAALGEQNVIDTTLAPNAVAA
jgi:hypothetical protein